MNAVYAPYRLPDGELSPETMSTAHTLRDWLADPEILRPPSAVIPHLAITGRVTLLSGREKVGKSTLAACAVAAASRGEPVLSVPVDQPVRTLWYAIDEHFADAVRRFQVLGANLDHVIINVEPRTERELLAALKQDLAAFPAVGLVVVDTLSRVFASSGVDPNSSHDVEPVIARLVDFFHRHGVASILLYHTGKGGKEYRGSTAIGATVDDILTLRRRGEQEGDDFDDDPSDDGRRLLVQDGRNLRGRLQLSCTAGVYQLYEESSPPRTRILTALRDHGSATGRAALVKLAGVRKDLGLRTVADLIGEGVVTENQHRLTLTLFGMKELGSALIAGSDHSPTQEPVATGPQSPGSHGFPERGTAPEPTREPPFMPPILPGSHSPHPHPSETGTGLPADSQTSIQWDLPC